MGSRVKEDERHEKIIRGLLKLPGNRRCINCNSLGPQYVCTSFSTFICTNCSGIHREFTHRVKSISVAKFTPQEVSALQEGGNERAKEIYFKNWDFQGQSAIDSSDVDRLRTVIKNVYVERRYTGQRAGDHLPQAKVQGNRDSFGNSNADSSQGVLRSPHAGTYGNNHGSKGSIKSRSEDRNDANGHPVGGTVDQNNSSTMGAEKAKFRSHLRAYLLKTGGKSENNQKDVIASSSSVVQASKGTNSNNVILPIRLPDPSMSQKATTSNASTEAQKPASLKTTDPRPGSMKDAKLYVSENLIDFDSDLEPPQGVVQTELQKNPLPQTDVGWATFDVSIPNKTTATLSTSSTNSLEDPMLQIPNSASISQSRFPSLQTANSLSFSPANHGTQKNQHYFSPANNIQSNNPPLNRATSAPVNSQFWRAASHAPIVQGSSVRPANQGSNIFIGAHDPAVVSAAQQPAATVASNGRKALPEDFFTMSYYPASSAWNLQANPRANMGYGQYGMYPVGVANATQGARPNPENPVNLARGPISAYHSSPFPSLTSMQAALQNMGSRTLLPRGAGMGSVASVLSPPQVSFPLTADSQYIQQHAVKVQNDTFSAGYEGSRGFTSTANGIYPMDQSSAANLQVMTQNSLPRVGGNPFA